MQGRYTSILQPDSPPTPAGDHGLLLALIAGVLLSLGTVMVASAGASLEQPVFSPNIWRMPGGRQILFAVTGMGLMVLTARAAGPVLDSARWRQWGPVLLFAAVIAALVAAQIPGLAHSQRGSSRWLYFSVAGIPVGGQPSEPAKVAMVAMLASILTGRNVDPRSFRRCFVPAAVCIGLCAGLVGLEDFGTAVLLAAVGGAILLVGGCRFRHLFLLAGVGVAGMAALVSLAPYRIRRLTAFLDVWNDPQGTGYQAIQSLTTIVSGGWLGRGLGGGVQKYGYLPESHSDFIFAVLCEEAGFLGGLMVIALFCLYVWAGARIMNEARTRLERLLVFGITALVGLQAAMNIAVVTVTTPTTGISLPLVSAGGSGVMIYCVATGLLIGIHRRTAAGGGEAGPIIYEGRPIV